MSDSYDEIIVRYIGDIAVVEMIGEEKKLNGPFLQKLNDAFDNVLRHKSCKAMVTTSTGKIYSSGGDKDWVSQQSKEGIMKFSRAFNKTIGRILTFPLPTIAAINGHVFGSGAVLALAHDYRVMRTQKGWISLNEIHHKFMFPGFHLHMLRMKIPGGTTLTEAIALGKRFTSKEGKQCGLIQEICEPEQLESTAIKMAQKLVEGGEFDREALHQMKLDLYQPAMQHINNITQSRI